MSTGVETAQNLILNLHLNGAPWEQNHPGQMFENPLDVGTLFNGYMFVLLSSFEDPLNVNQFQRCESVGGREVRLRW